MTSQSPWQKTLDEVRGMGTRTKRRIAGGTFAGCLPVRLAGALRAGDVQVHAHRPAARDLVVLPGP